jgi:heptosyltransferase I
MPEPRFLVVRLSSLGDIVHTFSAVAGLRESFPRAEIFWLTHPRWQSLVESSHLATKIWAAETRSPSSIWALFRRIRQTRFSTAIDYQGLWKSAALPFFGGVPRRIGFSSKTIREFGVPILYTDRVQIMAEHIAEQNGELSLRAGARNGLAAVALSVSSIQEAFVMKLLRGLSIDRYIVLNPGGGWRSKCWPTDRFGALCWKIRDSFGYRCIVNFGPGEEDLVEQVKAASGNSEPVPYNGSLEQLMAILRNAACVVGCDTGPLHLAVALGTRTVALFGPTDPARNGPFRIKTNNGSKRKLDIVLRDQSAVTTYKRRDQTDPSLMKIEVDEVLDAVRLQVEASR